MRLIFAASAASLWALAGQAGAETFAASTVRLEHAAAIVTVIPEDRSNVDVVVSPGARVPAPTVRLTGDGVVINGGLRNRVRGCMSTLGRTQVRISGIGNVARDELPRITIRAPRALDISIGNAGVTTIGPSAGGSATFNGCGDATMAATSGALDVDLNGSGDVEVARVGGVLAAALNGSGSLRIERADAEAALRLNGSGDLDVGSVAGRLDARVTGSGSLEVASAGGDTRLALTGSGDVDAGAVTGSLDAQLQGSGSIDVASVAGPSATLNLTSSGDIRVRGGRVDRLSASSAGSGSVRFAGVAGVTRASVAGSGDVWIAEAGRVEQLSDRGSGSVRIGR